jgi:hypothetical protein
MHYEIFTTNDVHTLVYHSMWQTISSTDTVAIAKGIATIVSEMWYEAGDDAVAMMRINAPQILAENNLPADLVDEMMEVARAQEAKDANP